MVFAGRGGGRGAPAGDVVEEIPLKLQLAAGGPMAGLDDPAPEIREASARQHEVIGLQRNVLLAIADSPGGGVPQVRIEW